MPFPAWPDDIAQAGSHKFKVPLQSSTPLYDPGNLDDEVQYKLGAYHGDDEARDVPSNEKDPRPYNLQRHSFPTTFDLGGKDSVMHSISVQRRLPKKPSLPPAFKHNTLAPQSIESQRITSGALCSRPAREPASAHRLPSVERSFELLQSAGKRRSLHKFTTASSESNNSTLTLKVPVTPARPNAGPIRVSLSTASDSSEGSKATHVLPPPVSTTKGNRFVTLNGDSMDHDTTPLQHVRGLLLLHTPTRIDGTAIAESPSVNLVRTPALETDLALLRTASGNGLGPLVGPTYAEIARWKGKRRAHREDDEDDSRCNKANRVLELNNSTRAAAAAAPLPHTPTKRQKVLPSSPGSVNLLKLAKKLSPDRIGIANSRDKVIGRGLAERASTVLKKERSEWLMWEASTRTSRLNAMPAVLTGTKKRASIFAEDDDPQALPAQERIQATKTAARRVQRPDRVLEVVSVLEPLHHTLQMRGISARSESSTPAQLLHSEQILALCCDADSDRAQAEPKGIFPVLFSTSISHFASSGRSKRAALFATSATGPQNMESKNALVEVMKALAHAHGSQPRQTPPQPSNRLALDIWSPIELGLVPLSDIAEPKLCALLCTRFKLHKRDHSPIA
ncbi:hypothetical protein K437DRAFT_13729 [Tilletiaria anomala UBC 951]|uniref:Uncharacterized protein n=1 Tax=Tilletiaria anomala (strain ATCC 24038 / CBS 436.72 / UBC 951) TaxID=1037660 RepID=A0A066VL02_TILAU|nr:uncharacterized protein K437DRAFT_13729 [Tilletiaria anomala UBC 951]KDN39255.1 hypothetical protein K437DRAFT_13729 [Tilletiaria anomala UBC 951]